jgi:hypothetical protein
MGPSQSTGLRKQAQLGRPDWTVSVEPTFVVPTRL